MNKPVLLWRYTFTDYQGLTKREAMSMGHRAAKDHIECHHLGKLICTKLVKESSVFCPNGVEATIYAQYHFEAYGYEFREIVGVI